jgi:hypothetical protein
MPHSVAGLDSGEELIHCAGDLKIRESKAASSASRRPHRSSGTTLAFMPTDPESENDSLRIVGRSSVATAQPSSLLLRCRFAGHEAQRQDPDLGQASSQSWTSGRGYPAVFPRLR